ncbi:MAG: CNNM domain-containing protein [Gemmatimonadetes bacterium]|nr:CNNM domain-containing protein [Gemmatimonadota bacterium]MDA1103734.1 CNNM domain-containing protein [Gemmatimonadota bacterium]
MIVLAAASVALLLIVSAVLTAADTAAFQIGASHIRTLLDEGFDGARELATVRENRLAQRASVRIITQVCDLAALSIMVLTGGGTFGAAGPIGSAVIGIIIVIVAADLVPQAIASRRPVRLALSLAPLLLTSERIVRPLIAPVMKLEDRLGATDDVLSVHGRELREMQEIGEEEGVLEASENRLVERAFRLDELTAWDVMIPRVDIFAWKEEQTLAEIVGQLAAVPYSRVPVYRETVDDVTGIVYVREAYERFAKGERDTLLGDIAREPFFVPGSLSLTQLLQDFQARRIHLGIVADEFGGTDGLVTLEDILEELVGEIVDETDVEEEDMVRISDTVVECDAAVDIRDLENALDVTLPKVEHRSLNGFILEELGLVPRIGETFETGGVRIEILDASETQVLRARLTKLGEADADAP